jgi:hypothetical protein
MELPLALAVPVPVVLPVSFTVELNLTLNLNYRTPNPGALQHSATELQDVARVHSPQGNYQCLELIIKTYLSGYGSTTRVLLGL